MGSNENVQLVDRRSWAIAAGVAIAGATLVLYRWSPSSSKSSSRKKRPRKGWRDVHQALADNFSYLTLAEANIIKYTREYEKKKGKLKFKEKGGERVLPEEFFTQFLLSTNFFWGGANQGRPIQYMGYYDPKKTPCRNPFAQFD